MLPTWKNKWTSATCSHLPCALRTSPAWIKNPWICESSTAVTRASPGYPKLLPVARNKQWWGKARDSPWKDTLLCLITWSLLKPKSLKKTWSTATLWSITRQSTLWLGKAFSKSMLWKWALLVIQVLLERLVQAKILQVLAINATLTKTSSKMLQRKLDFWSLSTWLMGRTEKSEWFC